MATGEMAIPDQNVSADGRTKIGYRDSDHSYWLSTREKPERVGRGAVEVWSKPERVPSVTTILGVYDKPALVGAAANVTLDGVSTLLGAGVSFTGLSGWDIGGELYKRDLRHFQVWKGAADRGTFTHGVARAWIENGTVPARSEVHPDYAPYITAFGNFIVAHAPVSMASEVIVGSAIHGFAGRFDWLARLTKVCAIKSCACHEVIGLHGRLDFKTSKAIYPEYMAQLDLYEVGAREMGEQPSDYRAPLRLGKDGSYELQVSRLDVGDALPLIQGYRAKKRVENLHKHLNPRRGRN